MEIAAETQCVLYRYNRVNLQNFLTKRPNFLLFSYFLDLACPVLDQGIFEQYLTGAAVHSISEPNNCKGFRLDSGNQNQESNDLEELLKADEQIDEISQDKVNKRSKHIQQHGVNTKIINTITINLAPIMSNVNLGTVQRFREELETLYIYMVNVSNYQMTTEQQDRENLMRVE